MMFAGNPGVLAAGVSSEKTYDDFLAHIELMSGGQTRDWLSQAAWPTTAAALTTVAGPATENEVMIGSSWNRVFRSIFSVTFRVVQHGLPSLATLNGQVSNGRKLLLRVEPATVSSSGFVSVTRNGYTSNAGGQDTATRCTELLYWDGTQAQRMQPSLGLGPEPYDW